MDRRRSTVVIAAVLLAGMLVLPLAGTARAADSRSGETVIIAAGDVIDDDLYVTSNRFVLDGTVTGDVIALGSTIEIHGTVGGDLLAAGQSILVSGTVEDDMRAAGALITLGDASRVGDDVVAAAASLETRPGSTIAGDLLYAGAQALLAGAADGDAMIGTSSLSLQGTIGGSVTASVDAAGEAPPVSPFSFIPNMPQMPAVAPGLTFGPAARIGGSLMYTSPAASSIPSGVVAGGTSYNAPPPQEAEPAQPQTPPAVQHLLDAVRRLAALILVGLLAVWLVPRSLSRANEVLRTRPLPSLGSGLLAWVVAVFALLLILMATIVLAILLGILTLGSLVGVTLAVGGVSLGAGMTAFSLLVNYGSFIVVALWLGQAVLGRIQPAWGSRRVAPMLLGLVLTVALAAIPIVGGIVRLLIVLFGFGAIALGLWDAARPHLQRLMAPAPA